MVKCGYCDFNSFADTSQDERRLVMQAMVKELEARHCRPTTVFMGGGTPTHLEPDLLEDFVTAIQRLDLSLCEEWTSEANPESCTVEKLQILRRGGVTRISIGVQSWDAARLAFLDRPHGPEAAEIALERAKELGFDVSLDLIFGIPGQSLEEWQLELNRAISLSPQHLSCYQLTFEQGTKLEAARSRGLVQPASDEVLRDMLIWTRDRLQEAGYPAYEISNFARPGHECSHNIGYWRGQDYVGIGPGAASHYQGHRSTNLRPLAAYVDAVANSNCATFEAEVLSPEQRAREQVWLGLRMRAGVDLESTRLRTGFDVVERLLPLAADRWMRHGHLELSGPRLSIPEASVAWTDEIAATFLGHSV